MIRQPTDLELEALDEHLATVDEKERDNAAFYALHNRKTGMIYRTGARRPRPVRRREWIERNIRIRNVDAEIVPLIPNQVQRSLEAATILQERNHVPVRQIILKARKVGCCLHPSTRVLTADLRWVSIDSVAPGDVLFGCDEEAAGGKGTSRKMRPTTVEAKREIRSKALRIVMDFGEVTATPEHRFLVRRGSTQVWRTAAQLRVGDKLRYVTAPWGGSNFDDGWFGGIIDGEGHLRAHNRTGAELNVTQNPGLVLDRATKYLQNNGYFFDVCERGNAPGTATKLCVFRVDGILRLLGITRPTKHINRCWWVGKELPGKRCGITLGYIKSIEPLPEQRMIDLQTSTQTFVAEGIVSHNSTWVEAGGFEKGVREQHQKVMVVAHSDDTATEILKMVHIMRDYTPRTKTENWRFALKHAATYHIAFREPMLSEMMIASAQHSGREAPGRGFTPSYLHMSEEAFYPDARKTCKALLNSMPKRAKTSVFIESTANGDTGDFKERFWAAWEDRGKPIQERVQGWNANFFPWFEFDDYRWSRTVGNGKALPAHIANEIQTTLTEHERWLLGQKCFRRGRPGMEWEEIPCFDDRTRRPARKWALKGVGWLPVDLDQLAWRRSQIRDEFNADPLDPETWREFQEEFPSTPQEAFRVTGSLVFDQGAIYKAMERTRDPVFRGDLLDLSPLRSRLISPETLMSHPDSGPDREPVATIDFGLERT